ncbi:MAG TPA: lanthionine synthetase C family protein [Thermoanaerobaculia bacterium]|nr:lanthionine synthetase C family protein [Thermoanaerobaculia bacterium]
MAWAPLLDGPLADRARESIRAISGVLERQGAGTTDASYAWGLSGLALFHGYAAVAFDDERSADLAEARLAQAIEQAGEGSLSASFFTGLGGIAWTNQHLDELLTGQAEADCNEEIDEALLDLLQTAPWPWAYDLLYGLAGAGCYAVDHPDRETAARLLGPIVDRLDELARPAEAGLTWWTSPAVMARQAAEWFPDGHYDTGISHGVPGVIGLLGRVCEAGLETPKARRLLDGAVEWLLANRRPDDGGSAFGRYVTGSEIYTCRSAWCYGDPGVAAALLGAAQAADRPDWEREAIAIALHDCRRPRADKEVVDASLCHGAAGLGHLYNRLYQATGEEAFAAGAREWFEISFGLPGPETTGESIRLLEGAAGVGLAWIAAVSAVEPRWDRPLLLPSKTTGDRRP